MPDNWRWRVRAGSDRPSINVTVTAQPRLSGPFGFARALEEHLACDGPANGRYIDAASAASDGYELDKWPTGETVWVQPNVKEEQNG